ncbi:unnamed protein product [Tilletia laevis]|uniref:Uncharacterized protein n=2 Tax=Tilletia TaxID=13289 RepID=A0A177VDW1_9BASI|nr:hypothetical protein CF336_g4180 [Tilletia laevis]KAE8255564.1 hypothetical protein A4X03_0g5541 [Tilletia caries]KAE8195341.1 hypothetical protein CF335_g5118 [Tilletia laevis]CAD6893021.1 unnamed protein product [Tilletia caries]CAD6926638.1 unnamed protein product [Tilletia caries]
MSPPSVAVIQGSSKGIGLALTRAYLARSSLHVVSLSRNPSAAREAILSTDSSTSLLHKNTQDFSDAINKDGDQRLTTIEVDIKSEDSIKAAKDEVEKKFGKDSLRLLFNVSGVLRPEKNLTQIDAQSMLEHFQVNTFAPLLMFKHFQDLLPAKPGSFDEASSSEDDPAKGLLPNHASVLASLSARVGSIADNGRGGWYSYRSSKAALNQITRTLAHELVMRNRPALACALHPGTVRSELSKAFTGGPGGNGKQEKGNGEFETWESAEHLMRVIQGLEKGDNGVFRDWAGKDIPW